MIRIIKKKINMSDELKTKINWSFKFSKHKYELYKKCLRIVRNTNLAYVELHKVIINNQLYLLSNKKKYFYIGNIKKLMNNYKNIAEKIISMFNITYKQATDLYFHHINPLFRKDKPLYSNNFNLEY